MAKVKATTARKAKATRKPVSKKTQASIKRITKKTAVSPARPKTLRDFPEDEIRAAAVNNAQFRLEEICEAHGIMLETSDNFGDIGKDLDYVDIGLNFGLYSDSDQKHVIRFRGESDGPLLDAAVVAVQSVIARFTKLLGALEGSQPKPLPRGLYVKRDQRRKIVEASLYPTSDIPEGLTMAFEPIAGEPQPIQTAKPTVRTKHMDGTMVYAAVVDGVVKVVDETYDSVTAFCKRYNDLRSSDRPKAEIRMQWVEFNK